MVRLYKEQFGRGPTKTHTYIHRDLIVVILKDTMTPAEHNMAKAAAHHRIREARLFFQYATESDFVGTVEQITGLQGAGVHVDHRRASRRRRRVLLPRTWQLSGGEVSVHRAG